MKRKQGLKNTMVLLAVTLGAPLVYWAAWGGKSQEATTQPTTAPVEHRTLTFREAIDGGTSVDEMRDLIRKRRSDLEDIYADGLRPLDVAVLAGRADLVELLLGYGVDPNAHDGKGVTALHRAAQRGDLKSMDSLLVHRADPGVRTTMGELPADLARASDHPAALNLLDRYKPIDRAIKEYAQPLPADSTVDFITIPEAGPVRLSPRATARFLEIVNGTPDRQSQKDDVFLFTRPHFDVGDRKYYLGYGELMCRFPKGLEYYWSSEEITRMIARLVEIGPEIKKEDAEAVAAMLDSSAPKLPATQPTSQPTTQPH